MDNHKNALMYSSIDALIDEAGILEKYIYTLLSNLITISDRKDKAIEASSGIVSNLNKLDDIILELISRIERDCSKNIYRHDTSSRIEEGKSKLEKFKFADASDAPVTEEFDAEDLVALMEDVLYDDCEEDDCVEEFEDSDFQRLVKEFIGDKIKCD